jgi:protein involved in polysaccharide export with SLBB domain
MSARANTGIDTAIKYGRSRISAALLLLLMPAFAACLSAADPLPPPPPRPVVPQGPVADDTPVTPETPPFTPPPADSGPGSVPGNQPPSGSATSWRQRYELGAGDVLNFAFYGRADLNRAGIRIAPDGTISYLQAQGVQLAGLSIDEARTAVEAKLSEHYKAPRIIITPAEIGSKRFTVLGKVVNRGVFTLERPMTLVEAVANAGGMETGLFERNTIELADLDRSFLSRHGQPMKINFRRLFLESDMKENVEIEPGDFIFIASNLSNDYYVFGAVRAPGVQGLTPGATVATALARRDGFEKAAWLERILVVRGSLDKPKVYVINFKKILAGQEKDFPLQPKDIVYVADSPWSKAEEILGLATGAFMTSATSAWLNANYHPVLGNGGNSTQ